VHWVLLTSAVFLFFSQPQPQPQLNFNLNLNLNPNPNPNPNSTPNPNNTQATWLHPPHPKKLRSFQERRLIHSWMRSSVACAVIANPNPNLNPNPNPNPNSNYNHNPACMLVDVDDY
jgi:hypothetical protein